MPTMRARRRTGSSPTIRDVADDSGVSVATVSRVLAGNYPVAATTRKRVLESVERLNFTINAYARGLSGTAATPVAVLLSNIIGGSFAILATGAEREAARRGRLCLIGITDDDLEREAAQVELMREHRAGAVVIPGGTSSPDGYDERLRGYAKSLEAVGSRLVLCGRPPLDEPTSGAIVIDYDNERGAYEIATHLMASGHRNILALPGKSTNTTSAIRLRGYRRAANEHGASLTVRHGAFTRESGYESTKAAFTEYPGFTAVIAGTDGMAAGVLEAIREHGLRCPEDVSVVGYDDIPAAEDTSPPLTTVHVPYEEMGRLAIELALDPHSASMDPGVLPTHVVSRSSVAPPRVERR